MILDLYTTIQSELAKVLSKDITLFSHSQVSGGCINYCYTIETSEGPFFIKINHNQFPGMYAAEQHGLLLLKANSQFVIPEPVCSFENDHSTFLIMSWVSESTKGLHYEEEFGHALAHLHRHNASQFGLDHHNYIGSLPQQNHHHSSWVDFLTHERILPQLLLGKNSGIISAATIKAFDQLLKRLATIIPNEPPALLHGDLWNGNCMATADGPSIFDPAVYYGHREVDLAMTQLFGGFSDRMYEAYNEVYPLESGWKSRMEIHNLYPLLVHVNLFGTSYLNQVETILRKYS